MLAEILLEIQNCIITSYDERTGVMREILSEAQMRCPLSFDFKITALSSSEARTLTERIVRILGVDGVQRTTVANRGIDTFTVTLSSARLQYFVDIYMEVMACAKSYQASLS